MISAKLSDFILFKECLNLISQKKHLTQPGLEKIISLRYNLNKGLTNELIDSFPNIIPVKRPDYKFEEIPDPYWIAGFVSGDSSFSVSIEKSQTRVGSRIRMVFGTCLHIRDKNLLTGMAKYLLRDKNIEDTFPIEYQSSSVSPLNVENSVNIENNKYIYDSKSPPARSPTHRSSVGARVENSLLQIKKISAPARSPSVGWGKGYRGKNNTIF